MKRISTRIAAIPDSATLAISARAKQLKAEGEPVIAMSAGEPDFATPEHIVAAATEAAAEKANHGYSPVPGLPDLRAAVAERTSADLGVTYEAKQVLITNGAKQALANAFAAILDEGDELILPAPYWVSHYEAPRLAGAEVVTVGADERSGFRVTVDDLEAARTERTKALLFCSPSNPTGAVYPREEIEAIGRWALEHGIFVVADEIYDRLVFGDNEHHSIVSVVPELADHALIVNGVSKTYAMTGWRCGWLAGPADVITAAGRMQAHTTSNVSNVTQRAALAAVGGDQSCVETMRKAFDRRRAAIYDGLNDLPGVVCLEPQGAFYAFPSVEGLIGQDLKGETIASSFELAAFLLDEAKVAVVPGEAFGAPGYLRLSYALDDGDLAEAIDRLKKLL